MIDVLMPRLSDSMEQGLILQWLIDDGESVDIGDELLEIETDKATMAWEAEAEGVVSILVPAGETVPVGQVIARIGVAVAPHPDTPVPRPKMRMDSEPDPAAVPASERRPRTANAPTRANGDGTDRVLATPIARRLAGEHGIALADLAGTGPRGWITKADVLKALGHSVRLAPTAQGPPPPSSLPHPEDTAGTRTNLTRTQRVIARRMSEAKATIPHFQVETEVLMDRALALRDEIKRTVADPDPAPSINDLIVRASALALRLHPRANGSYRHDHFELHERVNVGVAVAAEDALIVPTLFDADTKSLIEVAAETQRLAERVRAGEITPAELSGATFTVSNLGMYGMTAITPVINPPQAAILGVGALRPTVALETGKIVERTLLTLTLSCDHRILYGADAAQFLAHIKELIETPLKLLL
jgi:pyruvate dehydrogenase E2 component (dihydrolipoamide acetyltransferase)